MNLKWNENFMSMVKGNPARVKWRRHKLNRFEKKKKKKGKEGKGLRDRDESSPPLYAE